jgi:hypothetical protein
MRTFMAGTIGLSLGLGSAFAQSPSNQQAAATLGRPVPAATLGRPSALTQQAVESTFQPTVYRVERPSGIAPVSGESAPLLAPIMGPPASDAPMQPMPMPPGGGPGSTATPPNAPAPSSSTPNYGPAASAPPYGSGWVPYNAYQGNPGYGMSGCSSGCCQTGCGGPSWLNWGVPANSYNEHIWTSLDLLFVSVPGIHTPLPLALHGTVPYTGAALPPTTVAIGNNDLINDLRLGGRLGAGLWLDPCHVNGFDASLMFVGPATRDISVSTNAAFPTLLRPYIVVNTPLPGTPAIPPTPPGQPNFADIVGQSGTAGTVAVHTYSFLVGGDADYRRQIFSNCGTTANLLLGFRYLHLDESLTITESGVGAAGAAPAVFALSDRFATTNNFYGGQIGLAIEKVWGPWSLESDVKIALGSTSQTVNISGANNFAANAAAGLFAQDSNSGIYNHSNVSVIPELGLKLGYQMTPRWRLTMGFTFLYWSNVLQPGNQIDPIVDETKVPKPGAPPQVFAPLPSANAHPIIPFTRSDYYVYGMTVGLTYKW